MLAGRLLEAANSDTPQQHKDFFVYIYILTLTIYPPFSFRFMAQSLSTVCHTDVIVHHILFPLFNSVTQPRSCG